MSPSSHVKALYSLDGSKTSNALISPKIKKSMFKEIFVAKKETIGVKLVKPPFTKTLLAKKKAIEVKTVEGTDLRHYNILRTTITC